MQQQETPVTREPWLQLSSPKHTVSAAQGSIILHPSHTEIKGTLTLHVDKSNKLIQQINSNWTNASIKDCSPLLIRFLTQNTLIQEKICLKKKTGSLTNQSI